MVNATMKIARIHTLPLMRPIPIANALSSESTAAMSATLPEITTLLSSLRLKSTPRQKSTSAEKSSSLGSETGPSWMYSAAGLNPLMSAIQNGKIISSAATETTTSTTQPLTRRLVREPPRGRRGLAGAGLTRPAGGAVAPRARLSTVIVEPFCGAGLVAQERDRDDRHEECENGGDRGAVPDARGGEEVGEGEVRGHD